MQVHHVIVHTPEQTRIILREAIEIVREIDPSEADFPAVFEQACKLLGARFSLAINDQPMPVALPDFAIPRSRH